MFLLKNAAKLRFLLGVIKFLQKNMSTLGAFVGLLFGRSRGGETICFLFMSGMDRLRLRLSKLSNNWQYAFVNSWI